MFKALNVNYYCMFRNLMKINVHLLKKYVKKCNLKFCIIFECETKCLHASNSPLFYIISIIEEKYHSEQKKINEICTIFEFM